MDFQQKGKQTCKLMDGLGARQALGRRRASWWWREPRYTHSHRFTSRFTPRFTPRFAANGLPTLATQRAAGRRKRRQLPPTLPPPTPPPTPPPAPPPAPFLPDRIGKRPRRERPPAVPLVPPDEVRMCSRLPCTLSRVPPAGTPGLSPKRGQLELLGQRYGPRNTCSVDTMLTLAQACRTAAHAPHSPTHSPTHRPTTHPRMPAQFAITKTEKQAFKQRRRGSAPGTELDESGAAWRSLLKAARCHARGDTRAKRQWYAHMCALDSGGPGGGGGGVGSAASAVCAECGCRCRCAQCRAGYCMRCAVCACKQPRLLGHCFGLMEQFFLLLPATRAASPLHFSTSTAWTCAAPTYMRPRLPLPRVSSLSPLQVRRAYVRLCICSECTDAAAAAAAECHRPGQPATRRGAARGGLCLSWPYLGSTCHGSTYCG